jgi:hypothetical protein
MRSSCSCAAAAAAFLLFIRFLFLFLYREDGAERGGEGALSLPLLLCFFYFLGIVGCLVVSASAPARCLLYLASVGHLYVPHI